MNRLMALAGAAGMVAVLASCGGGIAPDGSGSLRVLELKTEFYDVQSGSYVACDNVSQGGVVTTETNVAVSFSVAGSINSVDVGLRGVTTPMYDANYNTNIPASQLASLGGNSFKTVFRANSADPQTGPLPQSLRPQGIVVNPVAVTVKNVNAFNRQNLYGPGAFYAVVTANTSTGSSASGSTRYLTTIPVYSSCNVINDTGVKL